MALPKLLSPEFSVELPSTKQPLRFRPFLVKEEKVLFMAMESGDPKDIQKCVMDVLRSCILTPDVDVNNLTTYDIEFLFLQLRSKSVGETVEVTLTHQNEDVKKECQHQQKVTINVEDIKVQFNENHKDVVQITDDIGVKMKAPSLDFVMSKQSDQGPTIENSMDILAKCIVHVYDKDTVYEEFTVPEMKDFIESLTQEQFKNIQTFFETMPKLSHTVKYKCEKCGREETIVLEGLQSFFT